MKQILFAGVFIVALTLSACSNTDDKEAGVDQDADVTNSKEEQDNSVAEQTDNTDNGEMNHANDEMKQKLDNLDYTEIEIEADYGKDNEYEAEIEQDNGVVEAELEDELNGENLTGGEAFDNIFPGVEKLDIQQDTDKNEAIDQTLDAFQLKADYTKFELELTLQDGTKIEFEDEK